MRLKTIELLLLLGLDCISSYVPTVAFSSRTLALTSAKNTHEYRIVLAATGSDDESKKRPFRSRLEGNTRDPTEEELAIMDEMITKLADAKPYELPNAVRRAFRVISSPKFFLRIAERASSATDETQKEKLSALAANLVNTLEVVVETTEEQLDERAKEVEDVIKAAAEPNSGEFLVPLLPERIEAMRKKLKELDGSSLDEGFLSTIDAWMNKSQQDGMDLMVGILQKALQIYAGVQIGRARAGLASNNEEKTSEQKAAAGLFDKLLEIDTELWDAEIRSASKDVPPDKLISEVQRTMENVVLGLENGSMAQQVQAEYLRELVTRTEAVQKTL